jgi:signal transduction histidine kinase
MRSARAWRRAIARSDLRAALVIAGLLCLVVALQAAVLYAFMAKESLEQGDRWAEHALRMVRQLGYEHALSDSSVLEVARVLSELDLAVRVVDRRGEVRATWGAWPHADRTIPVAKSRGVLAFHLFRRDRYLSGAAPISRDLVVQVAVPLAPFAQELQEVERALIVIVMLSGIAALAVGVAASGWAFAPLRRTTEILDEIEGGAPGTRITTRGTGDAIDRHAETLNRVLAEIEASFARLRQFSSDVAHELRTPLNRIRNVVEVALMRGDDADLRGALLGVQRTIGELSDVVQTLLLVAEIDEGRFELRARPLDIDRWIADLTESYSPVFQERGVQLMASSEVGAIHADRSLVDRLATNLLENALQHTRAGDSVEIGADREGDMARIWVDDSGPGVPEDQRERVFDRFVRLDPHRESGSGLGLALARSIARLHGGDLTLGESPLGGARAIFSIPVICKDPELS